MATEQSTVQAAKEQAKEQAHNIAQTATEQTRNVVSDVAEEVRHQVSDQKSRLAANLREIGDELDQTATNGHGTVASLAGQAADTTYQVSRWIDTHEPRDMLAEVEDFARRRPVVFLLGATALGILMGRVTRSAVASARDNSASSTTIDLRETSGVPVMQPETAMPGYATPGTTSPAAPPAGYGIAGEPHLTGEQPDVERLAESGDPLRSRGYDPQSAYPNNDQPVKTGDVLPGSGSGTPTGSEGRSTP